MSDEMLLQEAKKARRMAYAPYSQFHVGAALLGKNGRIYHGCNIENSAYTPTNCAERTAFFKAISEGETEFVAIAIVGAKSEHEANNTCPPCGVCRQVMMEFCDVDSFRIILLNENRGICTYTLKELLPVGFGPSLLD